MSESSGEPLSGVGAASYWVPRHLLLSAWTGHAPFANWLVNALRPSSIVELGTHNGMSLFTFAEAARRASLSARIVAIDSWEGDEHAGFYGDEVLRSVEQIVDVDYQGRIELVRSYFSDARSLIPDGSVDLLHIDGRHGYDDVLEDWLLYRSSLSDRGVVLFHDTREYREGFGVHRFWDEFELDHDAFTFNHAHGLGVAAIGHNVPAPILQFLASAREDPATIRGFYAELGADIERAYWDRADLERRNQRISALESSCADLSRELEDAATQLDAARTTVRLLRESTSWRVTAPLRALTKALRRPSGR